MSRNISHSNIRRLVAVVVAGGVFGVAGVYAMASAEQAPSAPTGHDQRAVAEWAQARGLSGLSPASLSSAPSGQLTRREMAERQRLVAEWAHARGLSGLSPASLTRVDD